VLLDFYIDPETGEPHIYQHGVNEKEVAEVLSGDGLRWHAGNEKWCVVGKTGTGRILQIIFIQVEQPSETTFVITAYPPKKDLATAYRRRMKKKGKR